MKVVVGLGNPGDKYKNTRHNIGYIITGELVSKYNINGKTESKFNSIIGRGSINGVDTLVMQPLTYMNLSGEALSKVLNWYKIEPTEILVVYDDISIDLGRIRFRNSGTDGGHNGIKSIIQHFGGFKNFPRLKVGIGPDPGGAVRQAYVLEPFSKKEREVLDKVIPLCIEGIETFINHGIDQASNKFNGINVSDQ